MYDLFIYLFSSLCINLFDTLSVENERRTWTSQRLVCRGRYDVGVLERIRNDFSRHQTFFFISIRKRLIYLIAYQIIDNV